MIRRVFPAVLVLFGLCLSLIAQQQTLQTEDETITLEQLRLTGALDTAAALTLYRPDIFNTVDSSVLIHGLPILTLLDGRRFPISGALGRMGMVPSDIFPVAFLSAVEVQKVGPSPMYGADSPGGVINMHLNRYYSGGEVGFFYGKSSGKFGITDKQAYILGGVGNDKLQITAGAAYQESSGNVPRRVVVPER